MVVAVILLSRFTAREAVLLVITAIIASLNFLIVRGRRLRKVEELQV